MGRLRTAAIKCNYNEIDREIKCEMSNSDPDKDSQLHFPERPFRPY